MWPSWVFGPGFLTPPAQLPARCLLEPKKGLLEPQKGPGWGLPGIIIGPNMTILRFRGDLVPAHLELGFPGAP